MIAWKPVAEMPEEMKDGRSVLFWSEVTGWIILEWHRGRRGWFDEMDRQWDLSTFTHFCPINPPEPTP